MKKNILKKFIVLFSLAFVLFGYSFVFASDTIFPVITLSGTTLIDLTVGDTYEDPGATAIDDTDSSIAVITSDLALIDTTKVGIYTVTYTATDVAGNVATSTRTVNVKESIPTLDVTAPIITLSGTTPIDLTVGDTYEDPGATAIDDTDSSIAVITSDLALIDTTKVGIYTVTYTATDVAGNVATSTRTVNVKELPIVLKPINIHLSIVFEKTSLYNNDISVAACDSDNDKTTPDTITAYCALTQSGIESEWSGLWINSVGKIPNDFTNNLYWMWLANLNIDTSNPNSSYNLSAKQYELESNDKILFYFDTNPLNISTDNINPKVGDSIVIKITELGFAGWDPIWKPANGGNISIDESIYPLNENGEYKILVSSTNSIKIIGSKESFINSSELIISPTISDVIENHSSGSSGHSTQTPKVEEKIFSLDNALNFLSQNQNEAGLFSSPMYIDWAAIAAKAGDSTSLKSSILNYLKSNPIDSDIITDYERRAMALMSLGINPYNGTNINYINKITSSFDGTQIGNASLSNDDIFGLIVLANAGYTKNDEIIKSTVSYVIKNQSSNGSWGSVDMTAAAIESLNNFKSLSNVSEAISKGESYLITEQKTDGSFGNTSATSWAIQALSLNNSFDEQVDKAIKYLSTNQATDGGLNSSDMIVNRLWTTSYAIPGILKLFWSDILDSFSKEEIISTSLEKKAEDLPKIEIQKVEPLIEEKIEEIIPVVDNKIDSIPVETIVKEKIIKNKVSKKNLEQKIKLDAPSNNLLIASASDSVKNISNDTFMSLFFNVLDKLSIPFVWLFIHLGF